MLQFRVSRWRAVARIAIGVVLALAVWAALGPRPAAPPMPGRMVEVDGTRLHVLEQGMQHPGPTVVLETGFGGASIGWAWVQPRVAQFARVVSYDRAGLGWSERSDSPRDADTVARQLHALLQRIEAPRPYILVGHSLGGIFVRRYAALYPEEVGALVLVDSAHPQQPERLGAFHHRHPLSVVTVGRLFVRLRLVELFGIPEELDQLPPAARAAAHYFMRSPAHWEAMAREAAAFHRSLRQADDSAGFADLPIIVLSATSGRRPGWDGLQKELAGLSLQAELRAPAGTDHYGLATDHRQAVHTVRAIADAYSHARHRLAAGHSSRCDGRGPGPVTPSSGPGSHEEDCVSL